MINKIVQSLIRKIKNDPAYTVNEAWTFGSLFSVLTQRSISVFRGAKLRIMLKGGQGLTFVGKSTTIKHKRMLIIGKSVTIGDYAYIEALSKDGISLGNNAVIGRFATLKATGTLQHIGKGIKIGNNSNLGDYGYIEGIGGITIGDNVLTGPRVNFHSENHIFTDSKLPIKTQGLEGSGIKVEDNCWIGAGSIILDGVTIGEGSIIAAGAVVTKDIPPGSVAAGIPARIIRNRYQPRTSESRRC